MGLLGEDSEVYMVLMIERDDASASGYTQLRLASHEVRANGMLYRRGSRPTRSIGTAPKGPSGPVLPPGNAPIRGGRRRKRFKSSALKVSYHPSQFSLILSPLTRQRRPGVEVPRTVPRRMPRVSG